MATTRLPLSQAMIANMAALQASLRTGQRALADWEDGELAVSAVPGAGKSTGMAVAAAIAIAKNHLHRDRQLVIVTFTRSAVNNIRAKVNSHLRALRLPQSSFLVNTLHGLAFTIASSHRELSGFGANETQIISEAQKQRLVQRAVDRWLRDSPKQYQFLIEGRGFDGEDTERLRRQTVLRTDVLPALAREAIASAKSARLTPDDLRAAAPDFILEIAAGLYGTYNELLQREGAIDYDDMILGALRVLENDAVRQYWQERIFAVFEDEAQDSSPLQTQLLEILASAAGGERRLVRVGDPNQAINSTFTTADPRFFNEFCDRCAAQARFVTLDRAGRSTAIVMEAANFVLGWVNQSMYARREPPFRTQSIRAVDADDPQPNANPEPLGLGLEIQFPGSIDREARLIGDRVRQLHESNPSLSMAVLVRQHAQGKFLCDALQYLTRDHDIPVYDVEQRDRRSRVPAEILAVLQFLDRPHSPDNLKKALAVMKERQIIKPQDLNALASASEQFLYPTILDPPLGREAKEAQVKCTGLLRAKLELPLYNLPAFIGLTLEYDQGELATADKLSDRLSQQLAGNYHIAAAIETLQEIVDSENFEAVESENLENRYMRSGQLTVIGLHKAKGLDWDVVFIPFLHERIIPGKSFLPESVRFLGDYALPDVARAQIRTLIHQETIPDPLVAWEQCQSLKQGEEFRLLYVGMTRAKRLLWLSAGHSAPFNWNNLDNLTDNPDVCPALSALVKQFPHSLVRV